MAKKATPEQIAKIKRLTHNANQIIDRALEGQKEHLQYNVKAMTGSDRFSGATQGLTYRQAQKKIEDLEDFYKAKSTMKSGWREIVREAVKNANDTLTNKMGFNLSDKELAEALKQLNAMQKKDASRYAGMNLEQRRIQKNKEFYAAVEKVQAAKNRKGEDWKATAAEIGKALAQTVSEQATLKTILEEREQNK